MAFNNTKFILEELDSENFVVADFQETLRKARVLATHVEVIEEIRGYFKNKVFNTIIPRLVRLVEAPSHGKPISDYDPDSRATLAYQNLAKEVISRDGN